MAVENKLEKKLYNSFLEELKKLEIGYDYDCKAISKMIDLISAIDLLKSGISRDISLQIIRMYE